MRAIVFNGVNAALQQAARPEIGSDHEVLIQVALSGICRTDLYAAEGRIPVSPGRILGHEFSGSIVDAGDAAVELFPGQRVAVLPLLPCRQCLTCTEEEAQGTTCLSPGQFGLDQDGSFAEYITVPSAQVAPLPDSVSYRAGAYAEPVCAAMAVLKAGLDRRAKGLILGDNRFARLIRLILETQDFEHSEVRESADARDGVWDFVIETAGGQLSTLIGLLRPGGTLVLRSRQPEPAALPLIEAVRKEITIRAVNYGSFDEALGFLATHEDRLDGLLGETFPLEAWPEVSRHALGEESTKLFLNPEA